MSKFIVSQITGRIQEKFSNNIDVSDLNKEKDKEFEDKIITRCLAAFAVWAVGGASVEESGGAVTDGGDDNGIDAIFFNSNTKRLVIVQSKYIKDGTSEPSAAELRTFRDGVHDFLDGKLSKFNTKIKGKTKEINAISRFGTKCDIVLVYTGKSELAKHGADVINELMIGLNDSEQEDDESIFKYHNLSKDIIFDILSKEDNHSSIDLTFHLKEWGKVDSPYKAYYGRIYGSKIGEWWKEHQERLLQDNIRNMLGNTDVNQQIAYTAEHEPENFWYFNNGITVLAEYVEKSAENRDNRDFGYFSATKASVVNGAQTVSVIGNLFDKGIDLSKLEVPFRVISLSGGDLRLRKDITRTNNTQNTILSKDFIAQDSVQESLQKQMLLLGYEYQIKRDETFVSGEKKFDLDEAIESLVISGLNPSYAAAFRKEIGRFYISDKAPYKALFNDSISGYRLANSILIKRLIYKELNDLSGSLSGEEQYGRKSQILNNGSLIISQLVFSRLSFAKDINNKMVDLTLDNIAGISREIVNKVYQYTEANYAGSYLRTLFQNANKCSDIFNNA